MKFRDYLNETTDDKVIYVDNELWVTYGQGSGQTSYLPDLTKYLTDKGDDKNFDSLVPKLSRFAKSNKPMKQNKSKTVKMFEVPTYPHVQYEAYDIFGGDIKPNGKIYMIITEEKNTIVNFFKKKNEALAWMRSLSESTENYRLNESYKDMYISINPDYDSNSDEDIVITCNSNEQAENTAGIIEDYGVSVDDVIKNKIFIKGISTVSNQRELLELEKYLKKEGYKIV